MSLLEALNKSINDAAVKPEAKTPEPKVEVKTKPDSQESQDSQEKEVEVEISEEEALEAAEKELKKEAKKESSEASKPETPRLEKVIEDGVEREITLEDLKKGYQKGSVSGKRFEEASKMMKDAKQMESEVKEFVEFLRENPIMGLYEVLGEDQTNMTLEQYRREMAAFEGMDETARENYLLKRKLQMRDVKNQYKADKEYEVLSNEEAQKIKETLIPQVEKACASADLITDEMRTSLLRKMQVYGEQGKKSISYEEIEMLADEVREEYKSVIGNSFSKMDDEQYAKAIDIERARKILLAKFKVKKAQKVEPEEKSEKPKSKEFKSPKDYSNFWKNPT